MNKEEKHHVDYHISSHGISKEVEDEWKQKLGKPLLDELKETLQSYHILHVEELSVIKEYLGDGITAVDKEIQHFAANPKNRDDDDKLRMHHMHHEDIQLRDFLIGIRSKIEYMITNGIYKKVKH